jgi:hypothetical protein
MNPRFQASGISHKLIGNAENLWQAPSWNAETAEKSITTELSKEANQMMSSNPL